ncbi:hypothetical protein E1H12_19345, partial [Geitlerinema sp. P-1104]|nr:hypothetical protein [Geitlerinema sp. P-1104]
SLFPIPYSLFPIPYSLFPIPYSLFPVPYSLFPQNTTTELPLARLIHSANNCLRPSRNRPSK